MATNWFGLFLKQAHFLYFDNADGHAPTLLPTLTQTPARDRFLGHANYSTYSTTSTTASDSDTDTTYNNNENENDMGSDSDRFEFIAFLLWYMFLVFCCVVPTCCAYRRRRRLELRLTAQQQASLNHRLQHSNLYILSNMQRNANNSERIQEERKRILGETLKATTMTLAQTDIEDGDGDGASAEPDDVDVDAETTTRSATITTAAAATNKATNSTLPESANTSSPTTEEDMDAFADENGVVRLPADRQNANRTVPGCCAICLCPYVDGDQISWSTGSSSCLHAFHTDCVLSWLAKKEEPQCPVCRQPFCARAHVSDSNGNLPDPSSPASYNNTEPPSFFDSFSQAFALSQFYRRQEAAFAAARSPDDMEAIRRADQIEWRNLALRHHMLRASMLRDAEERAAAAAHQQQRGGDGTEGNNNNNNRARRMLMYDIPFTFRYIDRNNPSSSNDGGSGSGEGAAAAPPASAASSDTAEDRRPSLSVESGAATDAVNEVSRDINNGGAGGAADESNDTDDGARGSTIEDLERGSTDELAAQISDEPPSPSRPVVDGQ